ncbi:transposase (plasmid) [Candidatus Paracaedimonas acanthamoebae]|nr:transposase [Candidatus Paracaedimonas acanthamoebae]
MIEWEQTMELKILRRQGKSLRQIAREVGVSVNTVVKYLKHEGAVLYKSRPCKVKKLDVYKDYLRQRISSALPLKLPATVLLREIQQQGYQGGMTQLRLYLRSQSPVSIQEEERRFETLPGQQMQVDWVEFRKSPSFLAAFVATLGFSRYSYVCFVRDEKLETLIECHKEAFEYFGGVPYEVLYDNMKTVILERDTYGVGKHRFNPGMLDFARHYGFQLKVCRPYRAKTKGKVERFNRYVRYSFYNPLVSHLKMANLRLDRETANVEVLKWLRDVANVRIHGTTGEIPAQRLQEEQKYLQPLPSPYCGDFKTARAARIEETDLSSFCSQPLQHPLSVYQQVLEAL